MSQEECDNDRASYIERDGMSVHQSWWVAEYSEWGRLQVVLCFVTLPVGNQQLGELHVASLYTYISVL
jgi:hypothetical protein